MTGVVIDAQVLIQTRIVLMFSAKPVKKVDHFTAALEKAKRFRFESQMKGAAGLGADATDVFDTMPEVMPDLSGFGGIAHEFLKRARKRADASINSRRDQLRQQLKEKIGIGEAFRR